MNNHKGININIGGKECRKKHESDFNKHIENTIFKMENSSNKPTIEKSNNNFGGGKDCSHTPPTIQEDLWKQFAKEYSQLHSLDLEQVRYWFIPLIEFGKQNYTLIKN